MNLFKTTLALLAATSLVGCVATTGGAQKPADPFSVSNAAAFKAQRDLAIGAFKVSFVTFDKSSSKAESSMFSSSSGFAKMTVRAKLEGVDDATFQSLADFAYADFAQQLKASGYNVVGRAKVEAAQGYAALPTTPNPHKETSSFTAITGGSREAATFAPSGVPLYHEGEYGGAPQVVPSGMYKVAKAAGVPTINVHYVVHFAYFEGDARSSKNYSTGGVTHTANVSLGQVVRVEHGSRAVLAVDEGGTFNNPNGNIQLTWGETSNIQYGETSESTSGAQKAANAFSSVVGLVSGGSMAAQEYLIKADPKKYALAAQDVIGRTNTQFVGKLAALR